jgi:hypothetical protein
MPPSPAPCAAAGLSAQRVSEQPQFKHLVGNVIRQRPRQPRRRCPFQIVLDRRARHAQTPPDLTCAHPVMVKPQQMSQLTHAQFPLRRHPRLLVDYRRGRTASVDDLRGASAERRDRLRWPASNRNAGRNEIGIGGRNASEFVKAAAVGGIRCMSSYCRRATPRSAKRSPRAKRATPVR